MEDDMAVTASEPNVGHTEVTSIASESVSLSDMVRQALQENGHTFPSAWDFHGLGVIMTKCMKCGAPLKVQGPQAEGDAIHNRCTG